MGFCPFGIGSAQAAMTRQVATALVSRTPSPMSRCTPVAVAVAVAAAPVAENVSLATSRTSALQLTEPAPAPAPPPCMTCPAVGASMKRSHVSVSLQPSGATSPLQAMSDYSLQPSVTPVVAAVRSKRVEKPVAQSAVTPTVINVAAPSQPSLAASPSPGSAAAAAATAAAGAGATNKHSPLMLSSNWKEQWSASSSASAQRQQTRVLSARFDSEAVSTIRVNVQPTTSAPGCGCGCGCGDAHLNYRLEADGRSGEPMLALQTRDFPSPTDADSVATGAGAGAGAGAGIGIQQIMIDDAAVPGSAAAAALGSGPSGILDPYSPADKRYIEDLCRRVSTLLSHQSPLGKRDSTASSASESGSAVLDSLPVASPSLAERPFVSLLRPHGRNSPVSSVSTESSTESSLPSPVTRSESPLPDSVKRRRNSNTYEPFAKPCTSNGFKFFMEQHVENVIKQHKERQMRYLQVGTSEIFPPSINVYLQPDFVTYIKHSLCFV